MVTKTEVKEPLSLYGLLACASDLSKIQCVISEALSKKSDVNLQYALNGLERAAEGLSAYLQEIESNETTTA